LRPQSGILKVQDDVLKLQHDLLKVEIDESKLQSTLSKLQDADCNLQNDQLQLHNGLLKAQNNVLESRWSPPEQTDAGPAARPGARRSERRYASHAGYPQATAGRVPQFAEVSDWSSCAEWDSQRWNPPASEARLQFAEVRLQRERRT
jgi:hypothetical protein